MEYESLALNGQPMNGKWSENENGGVVMVGGGYNNQAIRVVGIFYKHFANVGACLTYF